MCRRRQNPGKDDINRSTVTVYEHGLVSWEFVVSYDEDDPKPKRPPSQMMGAVWGGITPWNRDLHLQAFGSLSTTRERPPPCQ